MYLGKHMLCSLVVCRPWRPRCQSLLGIRSRKEEFSHATLTPENALMIARRQTSFWEYSLLCFCCRLLPSKPMRMMRLYITAQRWGLKGTIFIFFAVRWTTCLVVNFWSLLLSLSRWCVDARYFVRSLAAPFRSSMPLEDLCVCARG